MLKMYFDMLFYYKFARFFLMEQNMYCFCGIELNHF